MNPRPALSERQQRALAPELLRSYADTVLANSSVAVRCVALRSELRTYSNVEQEGRALVQNCLGPLASRLEAALSRCLLTEEGRRILYVEHDLSALLRGDVAARFEAYRIGREIGALSPNDIRRCEDEPDLGWSTMGSNGAGVTTAAPRLLTGGRVSPIDTPPGKVDGEPIGTGGLMSFTLKAVLHFSGSTRDTVNKLMDRIGLTTPVADPVPGAAREFSRANALEISFQVALMRGGFTAQQAARIAAEWVQMDASGNLAPYWAANPKDVFGHGLGGCTLDFTHGHTTVEDLAYGLSDHPTDMVAPATITVINRGEIVRRVDEAA